MADFEPKKAWFKQLLSLKASDEASITERGCKLCRTDECRVSDGVRPIQWLTTTAIPLLTRLHFLFAA